MEAAEDGGRSNAAVFRNAMPFGLKLGFRNTAIWCGRAEAGMWPSSIVVRNPNFEGLPDVRFIERNHEVEALPTGTPDQALAKCICFGRLIRSLQHRQTERL